MKGFISGALIGAVVAGVAVALTTPKTGEELRGDIKENSLDAYHKGMEYSDDIKNKTKEAYNKGIDHAEGMKDKSTELYHNQIDAMNEKLDSLKKKTLHND